MVSNLNFLEGEAKWESEGKFVCKSFSKKISRCLCLRDLSGILVILLDEVCNNAYVFNEDGVLRFELCAPKDKGGMFFYDAYYVCNQLKLISIANGYYDVACDLDEKTGKFVKIYLSK